MAIQQVLSVYLNLKGDGAASTFVFALQNLYQFANGIAVPFGGAGVVPTSVSATNPPFPVTSATIDANGNITLTLTSPLGAGVIATFQLDLTFTSGSSTSASPTQTTNVTVVGSSTVVLGAGSNVVGHVITDTGSTTAVTGTVGVNIAQVNGATVSTATSGVQKVGVIGSTGNAFDTQSGQNQAAPAGIILTGAQFNTTPTTLTNGNVSPIQMDNAGNVLVNVKAGGTSGTVAQGSTTSGQSGMLIQGAVTTSPPTYTTAQTNPLSLDTSGNLRVTGSFSSGALADLVGTPGTLNAANTTATINAFGYTSVGMFLAAGTLVGTIVPEVSYDGGTTWVATFFDDPATSNKASSIVFGASNTATSRTIIGGGGASNYRVRVSAFTSGTASCTLRANEIADPSTLHAGSAGAVLPPTINQVGGSVTTAAPTYTTGTLNALSLTTAGALRVDGSGATQPVTLTSTTITGTVAVTQSTSPWVENVTQVASTTLGTPQSFGTAPTGVVIGVSSDGYISGTRARSNQTTTAAGVQDVNIVGALGVTNSATNGIFSRLTDNTTTVSVIATTNALKTDLSSVAGTATSTAAAGIQKVGISGNAGASMDAAIGGTQPANALQIGAQVTTAAPTYTTATTNALSLDTSGNLRVNSPAMADLVGAAGTLNAANTTATINAFGYTSIGMFLAAGTLVGTIVPEVSMDGGTTWVATFFDDPATSNKVSSIVFGASNTATTRSIVGASGASNYRVRVSAFTSGTASCTLRANDTGDPSTLHAGAAGSTLAPTVSLVGGSVTTAAPAYTTATMNSLSLDLFGSLRTIPSQKATYRAATAVLVSAAAGTGLFFTITGSGTKTIKVQRIVVAALNSGTLGVDRVQCAKYSTAPTGGTAVTLTQVPLDSNFAAGTATLCQVYSAAPTAGTKVGDIGSRVMLAKSTTTAEGAPFIEEVFDFRGKGETSPPVLRGSTQGLGCYFNVAPAATANVQVEVEWTEE